MDELYNVQIRFEREGEHRMVLQPVHGLSKERLSALQVRMLETGNIPGVLPIYVVEIDDQLILQYMISGHSMLHYALRIRKAGEQEILSLLSAIVSTIGNSLEYMLQESKYWVHERLVFIGANWEETQLLYVPLELEGVPKLREQFARFIGVLADYLKEHSDDKNDVFSDLIQYCQQTEWSLVGLKKRLVEMDNRTPDPYRQFEINEYAHNNRNPIVFDEPYASIDIGRQASGNVEIVPVGINSRPPIDKKKKMILCFTIFAFVVAWGQVAVIASEPSIYTGVGAAFWLASAVLWTVRLPGHEKESREEPDAGLFRFDSDLGEQLKANFMPHLSSAEHSDKQAANLEDYYRQLGDRTDLFAQRDVSMFTVALDEESVKKSILLMKKQKPVLEFWRNHTLERVELDKDSFLIGREDSDVDLTIPAPDVSRVHAELCTEASGTILRDLKAKNGTSLNEQKLIPYERYPLHDGDVIRIGAYNIVYKLLSA